MSRLFWIKNLVQLLFCYIVLKDIVIIYILQMFNWLIRLGNEVNGGYLQWKFVCYFKFGRVRLVVIKVDYINLVFISDVNVDIFFQSSIMYLYFLDIMNVSRFVINFIFGLESDGGFIKINFILW